MAVRAERESAESRPHEVRAANERLAREAERLRFAARVPLLCECSDPACNEIFLMSLDDFRAARDVFVTAPGHRVHEGRPEREQREFSLQRAG